MKTETRSKINSYKVYIADDGTEFTSETSCKEYELVARNCVLSYVVVDYDYKKHTNSFVCVFSVKQDAIDWITSRNKAFVGHEYYSMDRFKIIDHYIDSYKD